MTGIISRGLQGGNFSVWSFYWDRGKRIAPALIAVSAVLLVVGWFWLMPDDYKKLARHVSWSVLFKSNLGYLQEAGYFDSAAREKWLLHTWSLSIEWQFYLIFPLIIAAVWKVIPKRGALVATHVILLLMSFVICVILTRQDSAKAFYLFQSRAWELLLGGLVFLLFHHRRLSSLMCKIAEGLGLLLILASIVLLEASNAWPGMQALLPTLGASLVLVAQRDDSIWTGSGVAQWLGTRSYSIYLWHWPLVVGLAYVSQLHSAVWTLAGLLLALLMGELSYRWIEVPTRRALQVARPRYAVSCLLLVVLSVYSVGQWLRRDGEPSRLPPDVASVEAQKNNRNPRIDECLHHGIPCVYGGSDIKAILVGDSHADAVVTAAEAALPSVKQGIYFQAASSCLFIPETNYPNARDRGEPCSRMIDNIHEKLASDMLGAPLIVINRTSMYVYGHNEEGAEPQERKTQVFWNVLSDVATPEYLEDFSRHYIDTACSLAKDRPVYLVRPIPEMLAKVPTTIGKGLIMGQAHDVVISRADYQARNAFVWSIQDKAREQCGIKILDPLPYLCDANFCYGSKNEKPLYVDDNHLSEYGNRLLIPMFSEVFTQGAVAVSGVQKD